MNNITKALIVACVLNLVLVLVCGQMVLSMQKTVAHHESELTFKDNDFNNALGNGVIAVWQNWYKQQVGGTPQ